MPHGLRRQTTGDLTSSVRTHSVGNQKKMPMKSPSTRRFRQDAGDEILVVTAAHPRFAEASNANTCGRRTTAHMGMTGIVRMRRGRQSTGISQEPFGKAQTVVEEPPLSPLAQRLILKENA